MKILVFGFKPFGCYKKNITEEIIKKMRKGSDVRAVVFPVRFERKMFVKKIEQYKPAIILGLGMYPRARKIRIERRAVNKRQEGRGGKFQKIDADGPRYRFPNWKIQQDKNSHVTYNAGTYVCNFSMYTILGIAQKRGIRFAFLHIPKNYKVDRGVKYIEAKIREQC